MINRITLLLFIGLTWGQSTTIAVLDFEGKGVSQSETSTLTDRLRDEMFKTGVYIVLERGKMDEVLKEQGFQQTGICETECAVEVGKLLGVQQMVAGSIGKVGTVYTVSARVFDVKTGKILISANYDLIGDIGQLLIKGMKDVVNQLVTGRSGQKAKKTKPTQVYETPIKQPTVSVPNIDMVFVEGGTFQMGGNKGESDEKPIHTVTVSSFYMDKTEVTQAEYRKVMGKNPSSFSRCDDCPVEKVSWNDANAYAQKVGKRLPTEAEWEYAARGGNKSKGYTYSGGNDLDAVGWYRNNSGRKTHPVAQKQPNELGLYDMNGNVWEWCSDWYDEGYYSGSPQNDPQGSNSGKYRVLRGGCWDNRGSGCRVANRNRLNPVFRYPDRGFRLVLSQD